MYAQLLQWLSTHGRDISEDNILVEPRLVPGSGNGLFAKKMIDPSSPLFTIPSSALLNTLTLSPHYPQTHPKLTCTQYISLHLFLHRPVSGNQSRDPLFGPYISVLPKNFDSHPLTWLWRQQHGRAGSSFEFQLLDALPSQVMLKLNRILGLFKNDLTRIQDYLQRNPSVQDQKSKSPGQSMDEDYLWAWLNVNTRCIYHRLARSRSDPDNMTLCPILDFANHAANPPYTLPRASPADIWHIAPPMKHKFGHDFTLLSPSVSVTSPDAELFLKYGSHPNSTLFTEYGFVELNSEGEIMLDYAVEALFKLRGRVGLWMKDILVSEGYWGDWTLHSTPASAYPSYRLITALRLYHIFSNDVDTVPLGSDRLVDMWRDTTLGRRDAISQENECHWRLTLKHLCNDLVQDAKRGLIRVRDIQVPELHENGWVEFVKVSIEMLWREEVDVGCAVLKSLEEGADF
ncbi:SET domain-containing protein [Phlegmacium glaucopus]|nr:SET domain-containing protein [Phlegmacium glaucopus]